MARTEAGAVQNYQQPRTAMQSHIVEYRLLAQRI